MRVPFCTGKSLLECVLPEVCAHRQPTLCLLHALTNCLPMLFCLLQLGTCPHPTNSEYLQYKYEFIVQLRRAMLVMDIFILMCTYTLDDIIPVFFWLQIQPDAPDALQACSTGAFPHSSPFSSITWHTVS